MIEYAVVNVAARRTLKPAAPRPLPKPVRRLPPLPPFRRSTKAAIQPDEVSEEEERAGRDVSGVGGVGGNGWCLKGFKLKIPHC